jgi:hypothetical protein
VSAPGNAMPEICPNFVQTIGSRSVPLRPIGSQFDPRPAQRPGRTGIGRDGLGRSDNQPISLIMLRSLVRFQLAPLRRPRQTGNAVERTVVIYEGAQFVKRVPKAPLVVPVPETSLTCRPWARRSRPFAPSHRAGQSRPAAGRPRGSLDGPVSCSSHHGVRSPRRASWSSPCDAVTGTRCGPPPTPVGAGRAVGEAGCRSSVRRAKRHGVVRPQPGGLNQARGLAAMREP